MPKGSSCGTMGPFGSVWRAARTVPGQELGRLSERISGVFMPGRKFSSVDAPVVPGPAVKMSLNYPAVSGDFAGQCEDVALTSKPRSSPESPQSLRSSLGAPANSRGQPMEEEPQDSGIEKVRG